MFAEKNVVLRNNLAVVRPKDDIFCSKFMFKQKER